MLQGAGFTGAATGVNLARDIEQGWFDRLLVGPVAAVGPARRHRRQRRALRSLLPATFLVIVALAARHRRRELRRPRCSRSSLVMGMAAAMACWGCDRRAAVQTQQAAPLMQVVAFASILLHHRLRARGRCCADWLAAIAERQPGRYILEGVRQAFVGGVERRHHAATRSLRPGAAARVLRRLRASAGCSRDRRD